MRKIFRNKKALSPVVAAIILIAVTVAVSIAVAAWMGALTISFMKTEELTFTGRTWGANATNITIRIKNSGTATLTIDKIEVNTKLITDWNVVLADDETLDAGDEVEILITPVAGTFQTKDGFVPGTKYDIVVITAKGNRFGPYVATAPS